VDEGIVDESSRILNEYRNVIAPVGLSATVLSSLITSGRLVEFPRRVPRAVRTRINKALGPKKAMDKLYVAVAWSSVEKFVVTHDESDFDVTCCSLLSSSLGVRVASARGAVGLL